MNKKFRYTYNVNVYWLKLDSHIKIIELQLVTCLFKSKNIRTAAKFIGMLKYLYL